MNTDGVLLNMEPQNAVENEERQTIQTGQS